ncbi:PREDICTED: uncharacterized protein LOC109470218 isoform X2 [Branchiostoma belcheri]|uniref:Uncharacterized protein LOC109470218 isoform X2 n=1 Tax=Branchiostoma belcheri TaxID=7741 RepID=A0A6P4Y6G4_BRABE|nr:PREDICTED: uncharacterized protein LOC109470218 isoform X2 [Branchiostoma belcheri]
MDTGRHLDSELDLEPSPCVCARPGSSVLCGWCDERGKRRHRHSTRRKSSVAPRQMRRRSAAYSQGGRQELPPGSKPFVHHQDTHKYIEEYRASRQGSATELVRVTTPSVRMKPRVIEVCRTPRSGSRVKRTQFLPPNIITFQVFSEEPTPSSPQLSVPSHGQHNKHPIREVIQKTESFAKRNFPKGGERLSATPSSRSQTARASGRQSTQSEAPSDVIFPPRWRPQYLTFKDIYSLTGCKSVYY